MTVKEMHYDVKQKLNKIDSQQYRNLRIPEIDWKLNEAMELFIKMVAEPRQRSFMGFEKTQRTIDDIRTIVVNDNELTTTDLTDGSYSVTLPDNYMFHVSSYAKCTKGNCQANIRVDINQHDDKHEESPFDNSNFEWRDVNGRFYENGIRLFTDNTFSIQSLLLNYIRKPAYIHNAEDFLPGGQYNMPDGTVLTGSQDCELPEQTHREIVDLAVLIISGDLDNPNYQLKEAKLSLNNF